MTNCRAFECKREASWNLSMFVLDNAGAKGSHHKFHYCYKHIGVFFASFDNSPKFVEVEMSLLPVLEDK